MKDRKREKQRLKGKDREGERKKENGRSRNW